MKKTAKIQNGLFIRKDSHLTLSKKRKRMFSFFLLYARIIKCKKNILVDLKRTLNNYKFFLIYSRIKNKVEDIIGEHVCTHILRVKL